MLESLRVAKRRAVGTKQTLKVIQSGEAQAVFLAADADERVLAPVRAALAKHPVPTYEVDSMKRLGRACGIEVGAAAAALLS